MREHSGVRDLLSLAAAGGLDTAQQRRVEEHLHRCEACRAEFNGWTRLADALKELPTPHAPPELVLRTLRLLETHAAADKKKRAARAVPAFLILFSWIVTVLNWSLVRLFDLPLARWLDVSSTTVWVTYIGITWLATALAAGLLGKHWQQEGKTL